MSSKIRAEKEQSLEPPSSFMITSLLDDIILDILARVPRCDYPAISLVSKHFLSLVVSPEIYARRSLLGCTEACLYNMETKECRYYFLHRKAKGNNRMVLIPSLPAMPFEYCFVPVGSRIYAFGRCTTSSSFAIDCRFHTIQPLPNPKMLIPMATVVANVIDKKIYVIGYTTDEELKNVMVVFNTETQMWEPEVIEIDKYLGFYLYGNSVVIGGKIYMRYSKDSFVYEPEESKWETDKMLDSMDWKNVCAIDGVIYYCDIIDNKLRAYDTKSKNKCWRVVKGLEELVPVGIRTWWPHTVSHGGKLTVLLPKFESKGRRDIIFVEIATERCQGREIWGKIECCYNVSEGNTILMQPFVVMV